jgi:hypothetical protein
MSAPHETIQSRSGDVRNSLSLDLHKHIHHFRAIVVGDADGLLLDLLHLPL